MPDEETRHLAAYLFGDEDGIQAARRIDRRVARLPGLSGLHLLETSLGKLSRTPAARLSSGAGAVTALAA